ncbi:MAG: class I SAM-dependent methyltransferase [Paracoccaceae bacterium]
MASYQGDPNTYTRWSRSESAYTVLEWYVFLRTLGSVKGSSILDLACGEGRLSRELMRLGAARVIGTDVSSHMIEQAVARNQPDHEAHIGKALRYAVVDAADEGFVLAEPADIVTAMYLFHYAPSEAALFAMCRQIGRNLKPGGRFVTYTINPDYDFSAQDPAMEAQFGFRYETIKPPRHLLIIGGFEVDIWQWSTETHEAALTAAGLVDIKWHPLELPATRPDLAPQVQWYLDNPSCVVLSAERARD